MVTRLTEHFTLEELTVTQATRLGYSNEPPANVLPNLLVTAKGLEEVRALANAPIAVNSAYRSLQVNAWVGSKPTSQHVKGQAADIVCPKLTPKQLMALIYNSNIQYDQLLLEFSDPKTGLGGWVHISFAANPRREALTIDKSGTRRYVPGA